MLTEEELFMLLDSFEKHDLTQGKYNKVSFARFCSAVDNPDNCSDVISTPDFYVMT